MDNPNPFPLEHPQLRSLSEAQGDMSMQKLIDYVREHAQRGACMCGKCADAQPDAKEQQPQGHTADMIFFQVAAKDADVETLRKLIAENTQGIFATVDPLDGKEHNYMELGGWIGDQGLALMFMGLASLLGLCDLLTPKTMLGDLPEDLMRQMAGAGMVSIQANRA